MKYDISKVRYVSGHICQRCGYTEGFARTMCLHCGYDSAKNFHSVKMVNRLERRWWHYFHFDKWVEAEDQSTESGDGS